MNTTPDRLEHNMTTDCPPSRKRVDLQQRNEPAHEYGWRRMVVDCLGIAGVEDPGGSLPRRKKSGGRHAE